MIDKITASESRQISDRHVAELFNNLEPLEIRPEHGCSARLFQMQQTYKFSTGNLNNINFIIGIYKTLMQGALMDPLVEKIGGSFQKENNVKVWAPNRYVHTA